MSPFTRFLVLAASLTMFPGAVFAQSNLSEFGVALMHRKGGAPGALVGSAAASLRAAGAKVIMPEMLWSRARSYDVTYEQAMAESDRAVAQLKPQGAKKIVVAGQSFGANAAIGYGARRDGLAAVVALAPGHVPERTFFAQRVAPSVAKAKPGDGENLCELLRSERPWRTSNVLPWFWSEKVPAASPFPSAISWPMPKNAAAKKPVPFLWVIGRDDPLFAAGRDYAFNRAPKHPKSKYLEVNARHENTADVAKNEVVVGLSL